MTKSSFSFTFLLLTLIFCVCLIVSNLMEIKVVDFGFLTITAGVITFPISYIINDCIVEIYGLKKAKMVIWLGFAMNLLVSMLLQIGVWLPGSASWTGQDAMQLIFGAVPRIFAASFIAFVSGSMANAHVMSIMKRHDGNRRFSLRAIVSTVLGEGVDSCVFFPIAFAGILPWSEIGLLILTQTALKTAYEIIILPVTMQVVKKLREIEEHLPLDNESEISTHTI